MTSIRGPAMRLWRRGQALRRRRKVMADAFIITMFLVFLCVASPRQRSAPQPREEYMDTQVDIPGHNGQYVILYTTKTTTKAGVSTTSSPNTLFETPIERKTPRKNKNKENTNIYVNGDNPTEDYTQNISPNKVRYGNKKREVDRHTSIDPNSSPPEDWTIVKETENSAFGKNNGENEEPWFGKELEEDPNLGRGFQDEFVTYHSDGSSILWLENVTGVEKEGVLWLENVTGVEKEIVKMPNTVEKYENRSSINSKRILQKDKYSTIKIEENTLNNTFENKQIAREIKSKSRTGKYKYATYNVSNPNKFDLRDDIRQYFIQVGSLECFHNGTNLERTKISSKKSSKESCVCLEGYFGVDCGIPAAAWFSMYMNKFPDTRLTRRTIPRRIINGLPVNHEYAMFEARMHELYDLVDVFIVAESNYTAHGDAKNFNFLDKFRQGYLSQFQDKLVYVGLDEFPEMSRENGWMADAYIRYYLGNNGLPLIKGLRDDDLFVLSDADELPTREILTFLKVYDGYPEPVSFALRWNVFGFFWREPSEQSWWNLVRGVKEAMSVVSSAATVAMLRDVLYNNVFYIRKTGLWQYYKLAKKLREYREKGHIVKEWTAGTAGHYAGWHCSWCFSPENLVRKMDSAQANDIPRWGDYPEKKNLTYIRSRITTGIWFDDKKRFVAVRNTDDPYYAPRHLMQNPDLYRSILYHPDHRLNLNRPWMPP